MILYFNVIRYLKFFFHVSFKSSKTYFELHLFILFCHPKKFNTHYTPLRFADTRGASKMAAEGEDERTAKAHRERKSGPKAEKKKKRKQAQNEDGNQKNPKAFTFQSTVRAARQFRRKLDVQTKKHHVPLVDRTPLEPPPIVVAVIGPPKVGKSTLIGSLLKNFTRQNLTTIKGPITIVSGT
jgi:ATPase subunit of ABC transporter with duplicated ATPase domains